MRAVSSAPHRHLRRVRHPGTVNADPDLLLLTGQDAGPLLEAAVETAGGELLSWTARQVDHRPGVGTTVSYRARVRWGSGERQETLAATTGLRSTTQVPPGVLVLGDGEHQVAVWRFPVDPGLPALAAAWDRPSLARLLTRFGVPGVAPDGSTVTTRLRAYRPRRRAVVEARTDAGSLFVKVLRPHLVEALHRRHVLLHDAGLPVPRSLGWTDDGLLVLRALRGTGLRQQLRRGGPAPSGADLVGLLDRLPDAVLDLPHRRAWTDHVAHYARVVGATLPSQTTRVAELADRVSSALAGSPADEPTHGDFYEGQLLVTGDRVTGLLDVDTAGPGRRADDVACLLAHAHVLALMGHGDATSLRRVADGWQRAAEGTVDPTELRYRVAGVLMSLATGPHRVQDQGWRQATARRVDLVEEWVTAAETGRDPVPPSAAGATG